ncbi:hypothetical protein EW145_g4124 [Phellinidium pouzarii]|uniref:Uncharacterized protein n=1 Tax=Phellinidium pouzarii TaxID=167371 RepID=A0A4S4L4M6_9AGAM|nr:hypothetical protein EW145_g4124 [Phellinidium pouzarii]
MHSSMFRYTIYSSHVDAMMGSSIGFRTAKMQKWIPAPFISSHSFSNAHDVVTRIRATLASPCAKWDVDKARFSEERRYVRADFEQELTRLEERVDHVDVAASACQLYLVVGHNLLGETGEGPLATQIA